MGTVNVDQTVLTETLKRIQTALTDIQNAKASTTRKYQQLGSEWNDRKYQELGMVLSECNKAMISIHEVLREAGSRIYTLSQSLDEYDDIHIGSSESLGLSRYSRHLNRDEVNDRWKSGLARIEEIIQNYHYELNKRGVPDCKWLNNVLAKHKAEMMEQYAYELDVASGHANDTEHNANAYPEIENYPEFYDRLTCEFRQHCLTNTNPHYNEGVQWRDNCQRCVPVLEMQRRGEDVTAQPSPAGYDYLAYHPFDVWQNPSVLCTQGSGLEQIQNAMRTWGDGARAQIVVIWDNPHQGGHTFFAEQINGETVFTDPQTGRTDVIRYFDRVSADSTSFCRIDNLEFSELINNCYLEG